MRAIIYLVRIAIIFWLVYCIFWLIMLFATDCYDSAMDTDDGDDLFWELLWDYKPEPKKEYGY